MSDICSHSHKEDDVLVSVVVPAHNESMTIGACLEAVIESDYPSIEMIVVNDSSTDNTHNISAGYNGVRVIDVLVKSSAASKNAGAQIAKGKYLFF